MPTVRVTVGARYETTPPDRRAAAQGLVDDLERSGLDVEFEVIEYVPGVRGLGPYETIAIWIGTGAATTLVSLITADIYALAKKWGIKRLAEKRAQGRGGRGTSFTIYGPDGSVLQTWRSDEDSDAE